MRLIVGCLIGLCCLSVLVLGCGHRRSSELNVDEVQGYVNSVEKHLRNMRKALRAKNLKKAEDEYDEAKEIIDDYGDVLAAYPEFSELEEAIREADGSLCFGEVNAAMEDFFISVRAKELEAARKKIKKARSVFKRCEKKISERDDFIPLKMNIDSSSKVIVKLEKEIARPALLEKLEAAKAPLEQRKKSVLSRLDGLEKIPNNPELTLQLRAQLEQLSKDSKAEGPFSDEPEWSAFVKNMDKALLGMRQRLEKAARRGKLVWLVEDRLPAAEKIAQSAPKAKDKKEAIRLLDGAKAIYVKCVETVAKSLKAEKGLSKYVFSVKGKKRKPGWLKKHCSKSRRTIERMQYKLSGKKPPKRKKKRRRIKRW